MDIAPDITVSVLSIKRQAVKRRPVLGRRLLGKKTQFQPMQRRLADGAV
jgi:hypothetical protein